MLATCSAWLDLSEVGETAPESRGVTNDVFLELKVQNTTVARAIQTRAANL